MLLVSNNCELRSPLFSRNERKFPTSPSFAPIFIPKYATIIKNIVFFTHRNYLYYSVLFDSKNSKIRFSI